MTIELKRISNTYSDALPIQSVDRIVKYLGLCELPRVLIVDRCWNNYLLGHRIGPSYELKGGYHPSLVPVACTKSPELQLRLGSKSHDYSEIERTSCPYTCPLANMTNLENLNSAWHWWKPEDTFLQLFVNKCLPNDHKSNWWQSLPKDAIARTLEYLSHSDMLAVNLTCKPEGIVEEGFFTPRSRKLGTYHPSLIPAACKTQFEESNSVKTPFTYEAYQKLKEIHDRFGVALAPCLNIFHLKCMNAPIDNAILDKICQIFPNLISLDLTFCEQLSNLSPIAQLNCLESLDLSECPQLTDLGPISKLTKIKGLNLSQCLGIIDLNPISNFQDLENLALDGCSRVIDFAPLRNLGSLGILDLSATRILKLDSIAGLVLLQTLILKGCTEIPSEELSYLESLTQLKTVVADMPLNDVGMDRLSSLPLLEKLFLSDCSNVSDVGLAHLASLNNLQRLELQRCLLLTNLLPLAGMTTLQSLLVMAPQVKDLSPVAELTQLKNLSIVCDPLQTCQQVYLGKLTRLEGLITNLPIDDQALNFLSMFQNLERLNLSNCSNVTDEGLFVLRRLLHLKTLFIAQSTHISDVGMNNLANFQTLNHLTLLGSRQLTNVGLMYQLTNSHLTFLKLSRGSHITRIGVEEFRTAGSKIRLIFTPN